jgi:hypothetical protein
LRETATIEHLQRSSVKEPTMQIEVFVFSELRAHDSAVPSGNSVYPSGFKRHRVQLYAVDHHAVRFEQVDARQRVRRASRPRTSNGFRGHTSSIKKSLLIVLNCCPHLYQRSD